MPSHFNRLTSRKSRSRFNLDTKAQNRFIYTELPTQFASGMDAVVEIAEEVVNVDTGRMQKSIRHPDPVVEGSRILCPLIVGGVKVRGVFSEQTFEREVDYSLSVEIRYGTLRSHIPEFSDAIVQRMRNKR